jgi:hypothetical protein
VQRIAVEQLNASIRDIPVPERMMHRPVSRQGYPVPYFVAKNKEGEWDFRVIHPETAIRCMRQKICWMCGKPLGQFLCFVAGPMCVATRTSAEPPCHLECARYAAIACPFLSQPRMKRNEVDLPEGHTAPAGTAIMRNPGCAAVLVTRTWKPFRDGNGGILIRMGDPQRVEWYAQRRAATRQEVQDSIVSGSRLLFETCPPEEHDEIKQNLLRVENNYLPAA